MTEVAEFYRRFPVREPWLSQIVAFLMTQAKGQARVQRIAEAITDANAENQAPVETIYRAINTYCPDAEDYREDRPAIFRKVERGVYAVASWPLPPALPPSDLHFRSTAAQFIADTVVERMDKTTRQKWASLPLEVKMERFAANPNIRKAVEDLAASRSEG